MSIKIITRTEESTSIESIEVMAVRDLFNEKKIIARIAGLPRGVVLWEGEEEYAVAGNWTNDTVAARAAEVLSAVPVKWE
jgi:hypothetical protein